MDKPHGKRVPRAERSPEDEKIHLDPGEPYSKNNKLENVRPYWHTWILDQKIHLYP